MCTYKLRWYCMVCVVSSGKNRQTLPRLLAAECNISRLLLSVCFSLECVLICVQFEWYCARSIFMRLGNCVVVLAKKGNVVWNMKNNKSTPYTQKTHASRERIYSAARGAIRNEHIYTWIESSSTFQRVMPPPPPPLNHHLHTILLWARVKSTIKCEWCGLLANRTGERSRVVGEHVCARLSRPHAAAKSAHFSTSLLNNHRAKKRPRRGTSVSSSTTKLLLLSSSSSFSTT